MKHPRVPKTFPGGAAVAAADHEHPFDRLSAAEGWMDQRFVIVPFLPLGGHPAAIEQQAFAVSLAADHADALERAGLLHEHVTGEAVADPAVFFIDPSAHGAGVRDLSSELADGVEVPA